MFQHLLLNGPCTCEMQSLGKHPRLGMMPFFEIAIEDGSEAPRRRSGRAPELTVRVFVPPALADQLLTKLVLGAEVIVCGHGLGLRLHQDETDLRYWVECVAESIRVV